MFMGRDPLTWCLAAVGLVVAAIIFFRRIERHGLPRWKLRPPNARERLGMGVWLIAFLVALTNYYADWRLFDGYDNWVVLGMFLSGLFLVERLPGVTRT